MPHMGSPLATRSASSSISQDLPIFGALPRMLRPLGNRPRTTNSCGMNSRSMSFTKVASKPYIACNLWSKDGALEYGLAATPEAEEHPYFTQIGTDREGNPNQYIANMRDGATAGFKLFDLSGVTAISATLSCLGSGKLEMRTRLGGIFPSARFLLRKKKEQKQLLHKSKPLTVLLLCILHIEEPLRLIFGRLH